MAKFLKLQGFNYVCLGAGAFSYVIMAMLELLALANDNIFHYQLLIGILMSIFFICGLIYFQNWSVKIELYNVEELLKYIILLNIITSLALSYRFINYDFSNSTRLILDLIASFIVSVCFLISIALLRKLIFIRKSKRVIYLWRAFIGLLLVVALSNIGLFLSIPMSLTLILNIMIIILCLPLSVNISWLALLSFRSKWICLALLSVILLFLSITLLGIITDNELLSSTYYNYVDKSFIIALGIFIYIYCVVSLLAIIFNLPIAKILAEREAEFNSIRQIQDIVQDNISKKEIFEKLLTVSIKNTKSEAGWILSSKKQKKLNFFSKINVSDDTLYPIDGIINVLTSTSKYYDQIYVPNIQKDDSFMHVDEHHKSFVFFPIVYQNKLIGKMVLLKSYINGFDEYMIRLVKTYIEQTILSLSKAELIETAIESARLKEELNIAQAVQKRLLPNTIPDNPFFEIAAHSEPASEVGGDYYDFTKLNDNLYAAIVGDVSGKGISAAFHMAEMKGIFQSLTQIDPEPKAFISKANEAIGRCFERGIFITLAYLLIDVEKKEVRYARAGHCPLLYYTKATNSINFLQDDGLGLGIIQGELFQQYINVYRLAYETGDAIILYTDGITEAREMLGKNNLIKEYGDNRLKKIAYKHIKDSPAIIRDSIITDLKSFQGEMVKFDDSTIMVIKFK